MTNRPIWKFVVLFPLFAFIYGIARAAPIDELSQPEDAATEVREFDLLSDLDESDSQGDLASERSISGPSESAVEAFLRGNIEECMAHLRKEVASNPDSPPPKLMLAGLCLKAQQYERCRQLLEEVAGADSNHPELFLTFANLALQEGRLTEAWLLLGEMERVGPRNSWTDEERLMFQAALVGGRANVALRRKNWDRAQSLLADWMKLEPGNARLRDRRATALFHAGREPQAFEEFDIAYQQSPDVLVPPQIAMGVLFVQQGDFDEANAWFAKALKLYPDSATVHFQWAMALLYQDRADEAATHADEAARLGMDSVTLDVQRGIIARQGRHLAQAVTYLSQALERSPDHQAAQYHLALTYLAQGERERAFELAQTQSTQNPTSYWAWAALGWAHYAHGRRDEAEESLRKAMSLGSRYPEILYLFGRVLSAQGKGAEAQQIAQVLSTLVDKPEVFVTRQQAKQWIAEVSPQE